MNREKYFVKSMVIYAIGTFIPKLSHLVLLPLYTAFLTKAEFGTYDLYQTIISIFVPMATFEIEQAAFRYLINTEDNINYSVLITNTITFVSPLILLLSSLFLSPIFSISFGLKLILFFYAAISAFNEVIKMIARGLRLNSLYSLAAVISTAIGVGVAIFTIYFMQLGLEGVFIALIIHNSFSILFILLKSDILIHLKSNSFSVDITKKLLKYSAPLIPTAIASWVLSLSDRLVISYVLGIEANAIYSVANKLPQIGYILVTVFDLSWKESASLTAKADDVSYFYSRIFSNLLRFVTGGILVLISFSPLLFNILIKGDYSNAFPHMCILFIAMYFACLCKFYEGIFVAYYKTKELCVLVVFAAMINLTFDLAFIRTLGIYAGSLSTLISQVFLFILCLFLSKKLCRIRYEKQLIFGCFFIICISTYLISLRYTWISVIYMVASIVFFVFLNRTIILGVLNKFISKKRY